MRISRLWIGILLSTSAPVMAQQAPALDLGTIVFESESDETLLQNGYVSESGRQATKIDTPIAEIPQSIGVVTADQIEDQKPRQLLEALKYSAGASTTNFALDQRYDAFYLRGFAAFNNGFFRDGLRQVNGPSAWYRNDPYTIEGIGILRGPASSLYGVSGPGGLVNIVSKRPKDTSFRELRATAGTEGFGELAADVSGPLGEDGRLSYRLTGLLRDADSPYPGAKDDKTLVAPALTYRINDSAKITVLGEYADSTVGGTYSFYNPSYGVASTTPNADPDYNDFTQRQGRLGYEYEQEITDSITLRHKLRFSDVDSDLQYSGLYDAGGALARYWSHYAEEQYNLTTDNALEMRATTGAVDHRIMVGLDYTRSSYDAYLAPTSYVSAADAAAQPTPFYSGQETGQLGVYLHDQASLGALNVFVSGRYDWVDTETEDAAGTVTTTSANEFSGRIGVSYAMANGLTPFANLSSAFVPNTGLVYDDANSPNSGRAAAPTSALQKEIGLKYQLPGTESLITATLFDIEQEDGVVFQTLTQAESVAFGGLAQIQVPYDLRSRGIELEAQANLGNSLRLVGSYNYTDLEIVSGATGTVGNQLSSTPYHQASLWAFYEPQGGPLDGFGIGGGLRYVGGSYGDDANSFENADYLFADLAMTYDFGRAGFEGLELQADVKNVFDETGQTCSAGYCYRHEGRTARLAVQYRF